VSAVDRVRVGDFDVLAPAPLAEPGVDHQQELDGRRRTHVRDADDAQDEVALGEVGEFVPEPLGTVGAVEVVATLGESGDGFGLEVRTGRQHELIVVQRGRPIGERQAIPIRVDAGYLLDRQGDAAVDQLLDRPFRVVDRLLPEGHVQERRLIDVVRVGRDQPDLDVSGLDLTL